MDRFESGCVYLKFLEQKGDGKNVIKPYLVTVLAINGQKQRTSEFVDVTFDTSVPDVFSVDCNQLLEKLIDISTELGKDGWYILKHEMISQPAVFRVVFQRKVNRE